MFDWLFKKVKKEEFDHHKSAVQTALNSAKQDILNISKWVKHLDETDSDIKNDFEELKEELSSIKNELQEIKNMIEPSSQPMMFKQPQTVFNKQTAVDGVQTAVQTTVQAAFFDKLSVSEKAIMIILMQSDMKLSYEDLAALTGKDTATIRGQINAIRQKIGGLIEEQVERNNKKRLYVPEKIKNLLLKRIKVRSKKHKNKEIEAE